MRMFHRAERSGAGWSSSERKIAICVLMAMDMIARSSDLFAEPPTVLTLDDATRAKCLDVLERSLASDEFWPSMHAAEALTENGRGAVVLETLRPRHAAERDDQRRCGLAREAVRAGDGVRTGVLLEILEGKEAYGHTHACESLYKVWQIGDGRGLRLAMEHAERPVTRIMASAALARWGDPDALERIRRDVADDDLDTARIAAWCLARLGDESDWPVLRAGAARSADPLTRAYFEHALAALDEPQGLASLVDNLDHSDGAIRTYACEFAPDARAIGGAARLAALLDDPVLDVRIRAAQALLALAKPAPPDASFSNDPFPATESNPRTSEGSVIGLRDGRLLYATTEFLAESDFASARVVAVESADGGRTWSARRVLQENVGRMNVMSVTLRRLSPSGDRHAPIGFFYLVKNSVSDLDVLFRSSDDEGRTWSEPVLVSDAPGYHVMNNDRVTVLSTGRIVAPVSSTDDVHAVNHFVVSCFLSDDGGRTWRRGEGRVDYSGRGAMEPEVIERTDGRLLMHVRTQAGHIAVSHSDDQGETWSQAESWGVRSPESPATLRRIPSTGDWVLVWNNQYASGADHGGPRTPLTLAVSRDEGKTWTLHRDIETSTAHSFAYTSIAFERGRLLLSYYVGENASGRVASRFRSIPIRDLYRDRVGPHAAREERR